MESRFEFKLNGYFPEKLRLRHPLAREFLSEFACTFLFLLVGVGCVIQWKTSHGANDSFLSLNMCWGFAVAFGSGLGIGISGGHMNPAITIAQYLLGRKSLLQVIVYTPAQILGAFAGTAVAYWNYIPALNSFDGGHRIGDTTDPLGSLCFLVTCKAHYESPGAGILDQIIGTGILAGVMASMIDSHNQVPMFLHPLFGGMSVMMIGMAYGVDSRDFGARLFALCIYGGQAFKADHYWFWVPLLGPTLGGILGALLYNFLFDFHNPKDAPRRSVSYDSEEHKEPITGNHF